MLAALVVVWRFLALRAQREAPAPAPGMAPAGAPSEGVPRGTQVLESPRQPVVPSSEPRPEVDPRPSGSADSGSRLARELEEVMGSFLTSQPRVADLLGLSHDLAAQARVDPESVQVERDGDGGLRFARGTLLAEELRGTFLIEEGLFLVRFSTTAGDAPWGQCDLQITFGEPLSASGQVSVQFHSRTGEPASLHLGPEQERLVGWGVSVSPETGAQARPTTVSASGDAWQIGSGRGFEALELPWITGTASFEAWLRLLQPYTER